MKRKDLQHITLDHSAKRASIPNQEPFLTAEGITIPPTYSEKEIEIWITLLLAKKKIELEKKPKKKKSAN